MLSRRPHKITLKTDSKVVEDGELKNSPQLQITIKARFVEKFGLRVKKGKDEVEVTAIVYVDQEKISDASILEFEGVDYTIIHWKERQRSSMIFVTK